MLSTKRQLMTYIENRNTTLRIISKFGCARVKQPLICIKRNMQKAVCRQLKGITCTRWNDTLFCRSSTEQKEWIASVGRSLDIANNNTTHGSL